MEERIVEGLVLLRPIGYSATTRRMFRLLTITLLVCCHAVAQPLSQADTVDVPVEVRLAMVLDGGLENYEALASVRAAVDSPNEVSMGLLRQIARRPSAEVFLRKASLDPIRMGAMHALWVNGEGRGFFLAILDDWQNDYVAANEAARMLARDPDQELLHRVAEIRVGLAETIFPDPFGSTMVEIRQAIEAFDTYEGLTSESERAEFAVRGVSGWWYPHLHHGGGIFYGDVLSTMNYTYPDAYIEWLMFLDQSEKNPNLVVNSIESAIEMFVSLEGLGERQRQGLEEWFYDLSSPSVRELLGHNE